MKQIMKKHSLRQKPNQSLGKNSLKHLEDDAPWNIASCIKGSYVINNLKILCQLWGKLIFIKKESSVVHLLPLQTHLPHLQIT